MKNKLMGFVFTISMLTVAPILAAEASAPAAPTVVSEVTVETPVVVDSTGMFTSVLTTLLSPSQWHKGKAAYVSGTVALAVVAMIAYNLGKADVEETSKTKEGDLL